MENLKKLSYTDDNTEYFIATTSIDEVKKILHKYTIYDGWGNSGDKIMENIIITKPSTYFIKRDETTGFYIGELEKLN
jgi:hypothetical protein